MFSGSFECKPLNVVSVSNVEYGINGSRALHYPNGNTSCVVTKISDKTHRGFVAPHLSLLILYKFDSEYFLIKVQTVFIEVSEKYFMGNNIVYFRVLVFGKGDYSY